MEYTNPSNYKDIIIKIKMAETIEDVKNIIQEVFPDWICSIHSDYSSDYLDLRYSWQTMCKAMNTEAKGIILVSFIPPIAISDYSLITKFLDIMTANGFVVRRKEEFIGCDKCDKLIPNNKLYTLLKFKNPQTIPKVWNSMCSTCIE